jgi:sortase A
MQEEKKVLLKYFLVIFLFGLLLFNWKEVLLLTNYKVIQYRIGGIFAKDNSSTVTYSTPVLDGDLKLKNEDRKNVQREKKPIIESRKRSAKNNLIEIPKLGVSAPLIIPKTDEEEKLQALLESGTLLYPDFSKPGEKGQTIILGHSAPPGWPDINYENIFSKIGELEAGDSIFVYYNHEQYVFKVYDKKIFFPAQEDKYLYPPQREEPILTLLTCWPPGKNYKRLAVFAKLLDKSF